MFRSSSQDETNDLDHFDPLWTSEMVLIIRVVTFKVGQNDPGSFSLERVRGEYTVDDPVGGETQDNIDTLWRWSINGAKIAEV